MRTPLIGGCACGTRRYECTAAPIVEFLCHCRDCQRATGSAFAAVMMVPKAALTLDEAALKYHAVEANSGNTLQRGFCPDCGATLLWRWPGDEKIRVLLAGTLDDPSGYTPSCEVWTGSANPWHPHVPGVPHYPGKSPPEAVRGRIAAYFAAKEG